jgi:hypothetical protein
MPEDVICPRCGSGVLAQDTQTKVMKCLDCNFKWKRNAQGEIEAVPTETLISPAATTKPSEATMSEKPIEIQVTEKDRRFILAVMSLVMLAGEIGAGVYTAIFHPTADISILKEAILFTGGLVSTAWALYFNSRKNGIEKKA